MTDQIMKGAIEQMKTELKIAECDHLYAAMEWETDEEWAYEEKQCDVSTVTKIFCTKCLTKRDL